MLGYLGVQIKRIYQTSVEEKMKKEIVQKTVLYVEQTKGELTCEEKKKTVLEKTKEWLALKNLKVSDTELEILIESEVKLLKQKVN